MNHAGTHLPNNLPTTPTLARQDLGHAESCHTPTSAVLMSGGVTLSINPEARVYASLHEPVVHRLSANETSRIPVAVQNLALATSFIRAEIIEPAGGMVKLDWDGAALGGNVVEYRSLGITSRLTGFVEVTVSFCLPYELPDLGGRDRVRLVLHVAAAEADDTGGRHCC